MVVAAAAVDVAEGGVDVAEAGVGGDKKEEEC